MMGFLVVVQICVIFIYPTLGHQMKFEDHESLCRNESIGHPSPVYDTLEEGEMIGLRVVETLYGERGRDRLTGIHNNEDVENMSGSTKSRQKRAITAKTQKHWQDAIVPFSFDDDVPLDEKRETLIAMERYERYTCIRYVPWVLNQTMWEYGRPDEGHMRHVKRSGCWAFLGDNHSSKGQKISCCARKACVHELAHILGVFHSQVSPARQGWLRINWQNIATNNWGIYKEEEPTETRVYRYDLSSIMHYNSHGFSQNSWPTMTVLFKDLASLIDMGGNRFYLWQEIAETYQCKARHCPHFPIECINDGFVSLYEGECRCLCPPGLDHRTGCRTVIKEVTSPDAWPSGPFGVFSTLGECPSTEFLPLEFLPEAKLYDKSAQFHLGGNISKEGVKLLLCMKDSNPPSETSVVWQTGRYCLLAYFEGGCPTDFEATEIPLADFNITICCRDDGYTDDVIYLPIDTDFVLLPLKDDGPCQSVQGMRGVLEFLDLRIARTKIKLSSSIPFSVSSKSFLKMSFCYYTKVKTDCGGVVEMSKQLKSAVITSPGYPASYSPVMECYWLIKGPPNSTIVVDFDDFDVGEKTDECVGDYMIVRYSLLGQRAPKHCGNKLDRSFRTIENAVTLNLHTDITASHKGFSATVKLILPEDHCYNLADKGASYRGKVNFTRDFQPCLPWDRVTECPHHMFNSRDFGAMLEENYCRNPDNSFRPWCYTKTYEGQCERNYCDVCRLEKVFDNFPDCEQLKRDGLCERDPNAAMAQCAKTCAVPLPSREAPSGCGRPPIIYDALVTFSKPWYNVGDTVINTCTYGPDTITRRCYSDGTWSPANYVCGACSTGMVSYNGACYKFFPQLLKHTEAVDFCALHNSVLSSASSFEELEFIVSLRPKVRKMWLGSTRGEDAKEWVNTDGTRLEFNHWARGLVVVKEPVICAIIENERKNNTFNQVSCSDAMPFVCKRLPTPRRVCINRRWDCHFLLRRNPSVCSDYPDFARQQCPFSCGICERFSTPFCFAMPPGLNVVDTINVPAYYLARGDALNYRCRPGTVLRRGHLQRVCRDNGWLSGEDPMCIDENEIVTPINQVALVNRRKRGGKEVTYIGMYNSQYQIDREGEITQWRFYAKDYGSTCLQIWRPRPDIGPLEFEFVGQNHVNTLPERVTTVDVPQTQRIRVQPGDVIGLWSGNPYSEITWNECGTEEMPEANNSVILATSIASGAYFHVGQTYAAQDEKCRTFSVTAYVNETGRPLSYTSMTPIKAAEKRVIQNPNVVYTGSNDYFRIRVNGSLIEWQLYAQSEGNVALQVWRPRPDEGELRFEFIGQNPFETAEDTKHVISVPEAEQIKVRENDVIGIWFGKPPGSLPYETCKEKKNPQALPSVYMMDVSEFVIGNISQFKSSSSCKVFPLLAVIEEDT